MQAILKRMNLADEFDIVIFGDEVRSWPSLAVAVLSNLKARQNPAERKYS